MGKTETEVVEMHAVVHGYVQGVGFRATTYQHATHLGINGTVKNLEDGTVEIFAQGKQETLEQLLENLKNHPRLGSVDTIDKKFYPTKQTFSEFEILF